MTRKHTLIGCILALLLWLVGTYGISAQHNDTLLDVYGRPLPQDGTGLPPLFPSPAEPPPALGGIFDPYVTYPSGPWPEAVGFADLNSDGLMDAAVSGDNTSPGRLYVRLQQPDGSLGPFTTYSTGIRPNNLSVGDFNNDGRKDVVVANNGNNNIGVLLQQADGPLGLQVTYAASTNPDAIATGDLNEDCLDDVAVSHWSASNIRAFIQQPDGTLQSTLYPSPQAGYDDIDTGDVNNDGLVDIVKMNGQLYANPDLSVYLQNSDGTFDGPFSYSVTGTGNSLGNGLAVGDVTGDGLNDVVVAYGGNRPNSKVGVFVQTPDGVLTYSATYNAYDIPESAEIADVNLDGRLDVVVVHGAFIRVGVFLQQADGTLAPYQLYRVPYASHYEPQGLEVGDINHDGAPDVGLADYNHGLIVLYNTLPSFAMELASERFLGLPGTIYTGTLLLSPGNGFNSPVTLTIEGLPPGSSYVFSSNPVTPTAQTTFTITTDVLSESGAFPLTFKGSGNGVINTTTACLRIDPTAISGLTATNDSPTMLGNTTTLTGSVEVGDSIVYTWDFGDGTLGSGQVVTHTYPEIGSYTAVLTASNDINSQTTQTIVTIVEEAIEGLTAVNDSPTFVGQSTNFTATVSAGTNISYTWSFGDGTIDDGPFVSHIYPNVGTYTATVTATNFVNTLSTQTIVTIVEEDIGGLTAVNNSPTIIDQTTSLTATLSAGTNVSYTWSFGDGIIGSGPTVSHIYPEIGIYTATVTATNASNSLSAQTLVTVVDEAITGLTAVNDSPTLLGNVTALTATITGGTQANYTWDFGDGTLANGAVVSHTYPAAGDYTAVITVSNRVNSATATTLVQVLEPISDLTAWNDSPTPLGSITWLSATLTTGTDVVYTWDFGDGFVGSGIAVPHTYPAVGNYTAVVTATNSVNTLTATTTIEIIDEAITGLTAVNDGPTLLGDETVLSAAVASGSNVVYTWNLGDGAILTGAMVTHTYPLTGSYTAVVTASNTANEMSTMTAVVIYAPDSPLSSYALYLPVIQNIAGPSAEFPIQIGPAIPGRAVQQVGEVFFTTSIQLSDVLPVGGSFYLSAAPNQLQPIIVDDKLIIQSGGNTHFVHTFAEENGPGPEPALVELPREVMDDIAGQTVTVIYQDVFGVVVSASTIWLVWVP